MSYNVERGFHSSDHVLEKHRLGAAQHAVKQVRPDILALTEACYGGPNSYNIKMDYRQLFQFPYGQFAGYKSKRGDEGGNCLLSQFPMQAETFYLAYKVAVRGRIRLEDKTLTLDVVHPSYSVSDNEKISTLRPLLSSRGDPYLMTGDFNTVHPEDIYDWDEIIKGLRQSFSPEKASWIVENWRKAELVSWLLEQNVEDTFPPKSRQPTCPTRKKESAVRMDFCFKSPDLKVLDAYVLKNDDTEIASDHYPIVVKFGI